MRLRIFIRVRFVCGFLSLAPECDVEHRLIGARAQASLHAVRYKPRAIYRLPLVHVVGQYVKPLVRKHSIHGVDLAAAAVEDIPTPKVDVREHVFHLR